MSRTRRFLVVGMQRSGTTVTWSQMRQHPDIAMFGNELHASFFSTTILDRALDGETRDQRTTSLQAMVELLARPAATTRAVGLKTALPSAEYTARLVGCLLTHGSDFDIIAVRRRDLVAQLGSIRRAVASGQWHRQAKNHTTSTARVCIGDRELVDYVQDCIDSQRLLEQLAKQRRVTFLDYDDDIVTGQDWGRICDFLELPAGSRPTPQLAKVAPPASEYIEDYDRLQRIMATTIQARVEGTAPAPLFDATPSRLFRLHRATSAFAAGDDASVLRDALTSMHGRPEWGVTTNEWACQLIRDALFRRQDPALTDAVTARLQRERADDEHVQALLRRIASWPRP